MKRQLAKHAYHQVNKALALVRKSEMIGYHLEIIEIEKHIRVCMNPKGYRSEEEISQEEIYLIEQQKQLQSLKAIQTHVQNYKKKYGYIDQDKWNDINKTIKKMGFPSSVNECKTQKATYYYYFNQSMLSWITHNHKEAYKYTKKLLEVNPAPLNNLEHLTIYLEHSTSCFNLGKTDEILQTFKKVDELHQKGVFGKFDNIALKIFYYKSNYELISYVYAGDEDRIQKKLMEIEKGLEHWESKIPLAMKMILATGLKFGYLAIGEMKKMKQQINFLLANKNSGLRLDAYEDGLMWNMIYFFMKDDIDYLETQAEQAFKHFLNNEIKENIDINFKIKIAKLFLDYSRIQMDKKQFLESFKQMLEEKLSQFDNNYSEIDYPYYLWVNSQLSGKSLMDTAYEMSKKYLNK